MATEALRRLPALLAALFLAAGCSPVEADGLLALRLESPPAAEHWEHGVPLTLRAGGGHVHELPGALVRLEADTDPIHPSSASCHHGPPVTDPVPLEMRAFYDDERIYVEISWDDPTADRQDRLWRSTGEEWSVDDREADGVAILWSRDPRPFGCQEACHVDDWAVRGGSLVDVRSMYLEGREAWEEAWVWKASGAGGTLVLGPEGFATTTGQPYRSANSAAARDTSLPAETRRARTFSASDGPAAGAGGGPLAAGAREAPAWLWGAGLEEGGLDVQARRTARGWRVLFSRELTMDGRRQTFRPGKDRAFGVALFDATATDHHIVRDTQVLRLLEGRGSGAGEGEDEAPSRLGGLPGQAWKNGDDPVIKESGKDG